MMDMENSRNPSVIEITLVKYLMLLLITILLVKMKAEEFYGRNTKLAGKYGNELRCFSKYNFSNTALRINNRIDI